MESRVERILLQKMRFHRCFPPYCSAEKPFLLRVLTFVVVHYGFYHCIECTFLACIIHADTSITAASDIAENVTISVFFDIPQHISRHPGGRKHIRWPV